MTLPLQESSKVEKKKIHSSTGVWMTETTGTKCGIHPASPPLSAGSIHPFEMTSKQKIHRSKVYDHPDWPRWTDLPFQLSPGTLAGVRDLNFQRMTPVQAATIPLLLAERKDVAVQAQTGSGKTLAFLIPTIELLHRRLQHESSSSSSSSSSNTTTSSPAEPGEEDICHAVNAIIISPTRELALQIHQIAEYFLRYQAKEMTLTAFIGGTDIAASEEHFRQYGGRLLIGTPGRLESSLQTLTRSRHLSLSDFDILILDEADRLLEMGFEIDLDNIIRRLPRQRRTGLFSATQTRRVQQLSRVGLRNPVFVDTDSKTTLHPQRSELDLDADDDDPHHRGMEDDLIVDGTAVESIDTSKSSAISATPDTLKNYFFIAEPQRKFEHLVEFLRPRRKQGKAIVFFLTCAQVEYFYLLLQLLFPDGARLPPNPTTQQSKKKKKKKKKKKQFSTPQEAKGKKENDAADSESDDDDADEPPKKKRKQNNNGEIEDDMDGIGVISALHGRMANKRRLAEYERFLRCESGILLCTDVAARGVDIPDVDWILQFDPPQDPDSFVHRIGRTARMGRRGRSLVYLLPNEEAYVGFMERHRVKMNPLPGKLQPKLSEVQRRTGQDEREENTPATGEEDRWTRTEVESEGMSESDESSSSEEEEEMEEKKEEAEEGEQEEDKADIDRRQNPSRQEISSLRTEFQSQIYEFAKSDRNVMEKGQRAFVSFVRAYKEHICSFIFVLSELQLADCAHGYGLLFFPLLPDLKHLKIRFQLPFPELKANEIAYKDKFREKQRLQNAAAKHEKREAEKRKRLEKEKQRRKLKNPNEPKRRRKRLHQEFISEWDELQQEMRLLKRLRRQKITQKEYNAAIQEIETNVLQANRQAKILANQAAAKGKSEGKLLDEEIHAGKKKKKRKKRGGRK